MLGSVRKFRHYFRRINWNTDKLRHHRVKLDHHGIRLNVTLIPFWRKGEFAGVASF